MDAAPEVLGTQVGTGLRTWLMMFCMNGEGGQLR